MHSIGNDIIDLEHIDKTRTKDSRFYLKIISESEYALFQKQNIPLEDFLWLLWSIKESVYKCQKRILPGLLFSPLKIDVHQLIAPNNFRKLEFTNDSYEQTGFYAPSCWCGEIYSGSEKFYSRSFIDPRFIFTVAGTENDLEDICWGIRYIDDPDQDHQSRDVRDFTLKNLQKLFSCDDMLKIEKNVAGVPMLLKNLSVMDIPVSFSHHYYMVSYSFLNSKKDTLPA